MFYGLFFYLKKCVNRQYFTLFITQILYKTVYSEVSSSWSHPGGSPLEAINIVILYLCIEICIYTSKYDVYSFFKKNGSQLYTLFWHIVFHFNNMSFRALHINIQSFHFFLMVYITCFGFKHNYFYIDRCWGYFQPFALSVVWWTTLPISFHTWGRVYL